MLFSSYPSPIYQIGEYIVQAALFKNFSTLWQAWQFLKYITNSQNEEWENILGEKKSPSPNKQFQHISNQNYFTIFPRKFEDPSFQICKGEFAVQRLFWEMSELLVHNLSFLNLDPLSHL